MSGQPSTHGDNGRGLGRRPDGRFATGNRLGVGNPLAGRAAKLRGVLLRAMTPKRMKTVAEQLISRAEGGDLAAIRECLDRCIGRPAQQDLLERLERLEDFMRAQGARV